MSLHALPALQSPSTEPGVSLELLAVTSKENKLKVTLISINALVLMFHGITATGQAMISYQ